MALDKDSESWGRVHTFVSQNWFTDAAITPTQKASATSKERCKTCCKEHAVFSSKQAAT